MFRQAKNRLRIVAARLRIIGRQGAYMQARRVLSTICSGYIHAAKGALFLEQAFLFVSRIIRPKNLFTHFLSIQKYTLPFVVF